MQVPGAATDPTEVDVLVVGCGPTGLALAAELRSWDVAFRVVDRATDRVHESRALAIQARTLEVLARHGVTDRLLALGSRTVELHLHAGRRITRAPLFDIGSGGTAYPFLLFLSQATTEQVLADHLAARGVTCERGTELVGLDPRPGAVLCRLRDGDGGEEVVRARYVVGCDGAHSAVRRLAGIPFEGAAYPQSFVLADVEADGLAPGAAHAFLAPTGMLFFFPLGAPAPWRVLGMRSAPPDGDDPAPVALADVQALADAYTGGAVRVHDPVWMTDFRLHNRGAAHYRSGRVLLAGDAAHIHSPAGAQGMNTGIQDAVNLGWKLALVTAGRAGTELLGTYEAERAPVGRRVLRFTDRAFTVATSNSPVSRLVRTQIAPRAVPLALGWRRGRAIAFRTISELGISYRRSPLSAGGRGVGRRPRPGDRLPDAPVLADGRRTTLHRALAGRGFHLLLCGDPARWPADVAGAVAAWAEVAVVRLARSSSDGALVDPSGRVLRLLGVPGSGVGHLLVRPDGHVARRGGADLTGVEEYLRRWLPRRPGVARAPDASTGARWERGRMTSTPDDSRPEDSTSTSEPRPDDTVDDPDADPGMLNPRTGAQASGEESTSGYDDPDADPANLNPREG